jgi:hypothetical protein
MKPCQINLLGILFLLVENLIFAKNAYLGLEGFGADMEIVVD